MAAKKKKPKRSGRWQRPNGTRLTLFRHQNGLCCYCGDAMLIGDHSHPKCATLEHLKRKCEGGTNHIGNLAIACSECNNGRQSKSWLEWKTIQMDEAA
jgi:5-methylcytosine-specific restriction endonuclease McrA